ncbi:MAG: helix-turn-helix transcriptional regulator [Clostridia bacterium]|nr:helix-turn-helix transcriptional regulator [Clostridia bacterium]
MNIAATIAKYRKARGLTQEELGERLGVSNQAVSKWENAVSLPDITLLPSLARALGILLDVLLGEAEPGADDEYLHPDDVPEAAYDALHRTLDCLWRHGTGSADAHIAIRKEKLEKMKSGMMECTSETCGSVIVTDSLSFVDRTYRQPGSENLFLSRRLAGVLERMAEESTRKVLAYLYREAFARQVDTPITVREITEGTALNEDEVERALFTLEKLHIVEVANDDDETVCYLRTSYAVCALDLFKMAELLVNDRNWYALRNTQVILDASFCGYLPPYQPTK